MKAVIGIICVLGVASYASAQCAGFEHYTTTLVPSCDTNDVIIKWPNYRDQSTYYACAGVNKPILQYCPSGQYFIYVLQDCGPCSVYIPPVPCELLKTQTAPNCVPIDSDSGSSTDSGSGTTADNGSTVTLPTPKTPSSTESSAPTDAPTDAPTSPTPESEPPTDVNQPPTPGDNGVSGPPTPASSATDVPMPPSPVVTPPNIVVTPPTITTE